MPYERERDTAIAAVRAASRVCRGVQANLVTAETLEKRDRSPVTVADFASQAVVASVLAGAFPDDTVVGEEQAGELREDDQAAMRAAIVEHVATGLDGEAPAESKVLDLIDRCGLSRAEGDRYWTVDPIDGTKGFLRGGQYAVALALIESGRVVMGVLGCPNLDPGGGMAETGGAGLIMAAALGDGTHLWSMTDDGEGRSIRVSEVRRTEDARFCESVESGHSSHDDAAAVARALGITESSVRMDSQAKYATVARGEAQIYLRLPTRKDYRECIWDHAAGMITVTEAGGRVTDVHGRDLDFNHGRRLEANAGIIATNGPIHDRVVEAVRGVLG
ncbi:MAG: 3'(2'),5'-bisphosphate nucleotidase [Phycisphaeraceae bacterium]|nr:3'(2'),5'-bisphosphate nucleotidase [Phycisphaeraceae bacterium]